MKEMVTRPQMAIVNGAGNMAVASGVGSMAVSGNNVTVNDSNVILQFLAIIADQRKMIAGQIETIARLQDELLRLKGLKQ